MEQDPNQNNEEEIVSAEELADQAYAVLRERADDEASLRSSGGDRRGFSHLWLISYSDFMTILMIFFLALYGYAAMTKASLVPRKKLTYSEFAQMVALLKKDLGTQLEVEDGLKRVTIQMSDQVLFASGRSDLSSPARQTLAELANSLKLVDGDIVVQGHTDNVPIRTGPYKSNWELSAARAFSVIHVLEDFGVSADRMVAWGFGENRPLAANDSSINRSKNRRIEILVLKKENNDVQVF